MEEIGLFPLGAVLLPGERMPLHIFEPRYRELIGECLEQGREFGFVYADEQGVRDVGTRASVVEVLERFDDGRLNVLVEGGSRFRLLGLTSGRSFRTAEVEGVDDVTPAADDAEVERPLRLLRRVGELTGAELVDFDVSGAGASFQLAARVELDPPLKQGLLESRSESDRLRQVGDLLERAARALEQREERRRLAERNGHPRGGPRR